MWSTAARPVDMGFLVLDWPVGRGEDAFVISAVHEHVQRLAVGVNGGRAVDAEIVFLLARRPGGLAAAGGGLLPGFLHVVHFQRNDLDAVAVDQVVRRQLAGRRVGGGNDETAPVRNSRT